MKLYSYPCVRIVYNINKKGLAHREGVSRNEQPSTARNPERVVNIRELVARERGMTLKFTDVQLHNQR